MKTFTNCKKVLFVFSILTNLSPASCRSIMKCILKDSSVFESVCVCVCVWVCNICNRLLRRGCGRLYWCQCCCCFCCILKCATPRSAPSLVPVAPSLRATHLHSGALILWHSFVVGGSLMHVTCRARDFRAYLALDVQQENREKMKFLTCCVLQAERGVANQRERERYGGCGLLFICFMWLVICAQIRTGAEPSPRSTAYIRVVASSGSIHLPLDVATVGNSNPARLENTQQNVTQNMSEGFRSWLWSLRNRLKCDNIVYRLSNRVSRKCAAILLNSRVNKFHYLFVKLPRGSLVTRANRPHPLLLSPLRVMTFCIYRIHFYLQHERNYCLSAPAAASAEQLSNELSATATLHTVNQVGIVLGNCFSLQLGTQSHRWYLLKIFQMWNWSRPAVFSHSPLHHVSQFACGLIFSLDI